ncbi:uncharacterized protein LOC128990923 [Macrosteles quadrilineatus]|uniref:uncharacterized protein LOC128990923 n=1 Tax=Macrosteles quadrilineatus TaxID=74068 RepID=UPI0023E177CF|nr:uncharacterized protein LOC128990923 [Macrosteles quadrilineatus]
MKAFVAAVILIEIITVCAAEEYNILKGALQTSRTQGATSAFNIPQIDVCNTHKYIKFVAKFTSKIGSNEIRLRVEAHAAYPSLKNSFPALFKLHRYSHIATYEVENKFFTAKTAEEKKQVQQEVRDNLCKYIKVSDSKLNNQALYFIEFNYAKRLWCDAYSSIDLRPLEFDACDELKPDYEAANAYTVEVPKIQELIRDGAHCTLTTHTPDKAVFQIASQNCPVTETHPERLRLITYHGGLSLGHYSLFRNDNTNVDSTTVDKKKLFRLFRMYSYKNNFGAESYVNVQYLQQGYWKCQTFQRKVGYGTVYYSTDDYPRPCKRMQQEQLPYARGDNLKLVYMEKH